MKDILLQGKGITSLGLWLRQFFADFLVSAVMRVMGISNFSSNPSLGSLLFPGFIVSMLFFGFAYLEAGKIKKEDMAVLTAE